jgi:hypothetical protein
MSNYKFAVTLRVVLGRTKHEMQRTAGIFFPLRMEQTQHGAGDYLLSVLGRCEVFLYCIFNDAIIRLALICIVVSVTYTLHRIVTLRSVNSSETTGGRTDYTSEYSTAHLSFGIAEKH